ncbi:hypothetical protein LIER_41404 [Lithospermum erythrorhizon]|uniref:Uncharacterized protein n=1 Tax=Lithospermum erythrorhizon TaxID=34254 RepID=A0AAV3REM5_LITER
MADGEAAVKTPPQEGGAQPPLSSFGEVLSPTPLFSQVLQGSLKPMVQDFNSESLPFKPISMHQGRALNSHIAQKEGEARIADKVFDRLPQPGHCVKSGVQSAVPYGNRLGRKEMVSKVWKAK